MAYFVVRHRPTKLTTAFTLVELLVTMVILSILAGLSLSGLAASRQRAKIDKTKSTIRKLHEIVLPQYESYLSRRVKPATFAPIDRLKAIRLLMVQEMPDQWVDVYPAADLLSLSPPPTAPTRRYEKYYTNLSTAPGTQWSANRDKYEDSECLTMIVSRGGFSPDATEQFRTDEMGDIDRDGAPEFWDGWGRPIRFIRWPAGYVRGSYGWQRAGREPPTTQTPVAASYPDEFDPFGVSTAVAHPPAIGPQRDYAVFPLISSSGPDEATNDPLQLVTKGYGIQPSIVTWRLTPLDTIRQGVLVSGTLCNVAGDILFDPTDSNVFEVAKDAVRDNITNHDLIKK
jgi:prepilin-type N-terminal cleavage/methylation domain-containing protein